MKSNFRESLKYLHDSLQRGSRHSTELFKEYRRFSTNSPEYRHIAFLTSPEDGNVLLTIIVGMGNNHGWLMRDNTTYIVDGENIDAPCDWFKEQPLNLGDYFGDISNPLGPEVDFFNTVHPEVTKILTVMSSMVEGVIRGENGKV